MFCPNFGNVPRKESLFKYCLLKRMDRKEIWASYLKKWSEEVAIDDDRVEEDDIGSFTGHCASRGFQGIEKYKQQR